MTQWDFKNKGKSDWTGKSSFVLEVPLRYLRPSVIYSVPCDRILQRAYCFKYLLKIQFCLLISFILLSQASSNEAPDSNIVENEFYFLDSVCLVWICLSYFVAR